jgi:hypothetical protein
MDLVDMQNAREADVGGDSGGGGSNLYLGD